MPVPLHPSRLRERGYNQSDLLADSIASELDIPCVKDVLIRKRRTKTMSALAPQKRPRNVEGAFAVARPAAICGKTIVLVDDVLTTGSTVEACAMVLLKSGAQDVFVLTVARAL
jgi:ComF family protein